MFPWQERKETTKELKAAVWTLFESFESRTDDRTKHAFPSLITGSGMGKTRFGLQAPTLIKDVLQDLNLTLDETIFIDFNGGGDKIVAEDLTTGPETAIALRLLARGCFGIPVDEFRSALLDANLKSGPLTCKRFFEAVSAKLRAQLGRDEQSIITIFIHIDEFQLAHKKCVDIDKDKYSHYIKDMIYEIGMYRLKAAMAHKVFIIPLLTGTSRDGLDFELTKFKHHPLPMKPLSVEVALNLLKGSLVDSPLLKHTDLKKLIQEIGVIPRYLDWFRDTILRKENLNYWTQPDDPVFSIRHLGASFIGSPINNFKINSLTTKLEDKLNLFLSWCITGKTVGWDTKIKIDKEKEISVTDLTTHGNIF